jgi:hypothetical protein
MRVNREPGDLLTSPAKSFRRLLSQRPPKLWYLALCVRCSPLLSQPFASAEAREVWTTAHEVVHAAEATRAVPAAVWWREVAE